MNFLWLIQNSSNYLYLKNHFLIHLSDFLTFRAGRTNTKKFRVSGVKLPRLIKQPQGTAGLFCKTIRAVMRICPTKGYRRILAVGSPAEAWIRLDLGRTGTRPEPPDLDPMVRI
jgi:hypothetical protein